MKTLLFLVALVLCACSSEDAMPNDAGDASVLCVARGVRLTTEGCVTEQAAFAERVVASGACLHTTELRCLASDDDSGTERVWLFSGEYYADITGTQPCDRDVFEEARSAPACDESPGCSPCDGGLCELAQPCDL